MGVRPSCSVGVWLKRTYSRNHSLRQSSERDERERERRQKCESDLMLALAFQSMLSEQELVNTSKHCRGVMLVL